MVRKAASPGRRKLSVRPLHAGDWRVLERLFGAQGACGGCWCMYWRLPRGGRLWEQNQGAPNKRAFKKLVTGGRVFGCLAFVGDEPVGWCCLGPRGDFPRLERVKALGTDWKDTTWSVVCFYIPARWRHRGVAKALIKEAVRVAKDNGAAELEAYPVRYRSGGPIPAAFAWTGVPPIFEKAGFKNVTPPGNSRDIYKRTFRRCPSRQRG